MYCQVDEDESIDEGKAILEQLLQQKDEKIAKVTAIKAQFSLRQITFDNLTFC